MAATTPNEPATSCSTLDHLSMSFPRIQQHNLHCNENEITCLRRLLLLLLQPTKRSPANRRKNSNDCGYIFRQTERYDKQKLEASLRINTPATNDNDKHHSIHRRRRRNDRFMITRTTTVIHDNHFRTSLTASPLSHWSRFWTMLVLVFSILLGSAAAQTPTTSPTRPSTSAPTRSPTTSPSPRPTPNPTNNPSHQPSHGPSFQPSLRPSFQPSTTPSDGPSLQPSESPSTLPSQTPTESLQPTKQPSQSPSMSLYPSLRPSSRPSLVPTSVPSLAPSQSKAPSYFPSLGPSHSPSQRPTSSQQPSISPTRSSQPSGKPTTSSQPSPVPTTEPTLSMIPSVFPSLEPSSIPSSLPSEMPSVVPTRTDPLLSGRSFRQPFLLTVSELNATSQQRVADLYASYTAEFRPNAQRVISHCTILDQTSFPCFADEEDCLVDENATGLKITDLFLTDVDYSCSWRSVVANVTTFPEAFEDYVDGDKEGVLQDMQEFGLPVLRLFNSRPIAVVDTENPTAGPSPQPTVSPTTAAPVSPSVSPTKSPSGAPTTAPTLSLAPSVSMHPTTAPSLSLNPSGSPTLLPTAKPSQSQQPSEHPSSSVSPSNQPSLSLMPSASSAPSPAPIAPTGSSPELDNPTSGPTSGPTSAPTTAPSAFPTQPPTQGPTLGPSGRPTAAPSLAPQAPSTGAPSEIPSSKSALNNNNPTTPAGESEDSTIIIAVVLVAAVTGVAVCLVWIRRRRRMKHQDPYFLEHGGDPVMVAAPAKEPGTGKPWSTAAAAARSSNGKLTIQDMDSDAGVAIISPSDSLVSRQSLVSMGESGLGDESDLEGDNTRNLQDEFDMYKDQNLEQLRSDVEENVSGFEGIMSAAVTRALMGDDYPLLDLSNELTWGCSENATGTEIEASVLCEVNEWMKRKQESGPITVDQKRAFMQDILNRMVTSVRFGVLPADDASRTIHESAALLGLQLAHQLPMTTIIISGMRTTSGASHVMKVLREFGELDTVAIASGQRGFAIVRFRNPKSVDRVMRRYRNGDIVIQDVIVQMKALTPNGQVESRNRL